jgi:hypothetical protein
MHPMISVFGTTVHQSFPLMLVVGREPNTTEVTQPVVGQYDFRHHPRCAFWNMSYSFIARSIDRRGHELKARCVAHGSSPIVYADILPISLPNHVPTKQAARAQVRQAAIDQHLTVLFSHTAIIERVQVVLFSGLDHGVFQYAREVFAEACAARGLLAWSVPFFYGTNGPKLQAALTPDLHAIVNPITQTFWNSEASPV